MAPRLLMIHESPVPAALREVACADACCEGADAAAFNPDSLAQCAADLVIVIAIPPAPRALGLFRWLKIHAIATPTLAVLPEEPDHHLMEAAAEGVDDFVLCPVRKSEWRQRIIRLLGPSGSGATTARDRLVGEVGLSKLVGSAPAFVRTIARIPLAARSGRPVLITGETGTGKELCARAIHHLGPRRSYPFIPVDCGALPDHLFENELFGHAKGAFTDARADQRGFVAMADGGTLFLDEVDALPAAAQSKLLRFLQERTFKPLGADRFVRADVNVLAATNRDIDALVREHRFRSDLYFRLNVLSLHLVPLRARREDIPVLARHFVEVICAEQGLARKTLTPPAVRKLSLYGWPGNVRELYNVIQRALVFSEGDAIRPIDVTPHAMRDDEPDGGEAPSFRQARARALESFERGFVEELLQRHGGNVTRAAREAQKDRRAFGRLIKKYSLRQPES